MADLLPLPPHPTKVWMGHCLIPDRYSFPVSPLPPSFRPQKHLGEALPFLELTWGLLGGLGPAGLRLSCTQGQESEGTTR